MPVLFRSGMRPPTVPVPLERSKRKVIDTRFRSTACAAPRLLRSHTAGASVFCLTIALFTLPTLADAATLTLISSEARSQVAASNRANPNDVRQNDSFFAQVIEPGLGGSSQANARLGQMRFSTTADDTTGSGPFGTTNSTILSFLFRYNGTTPLTLAAGALTYSADADFGRSFARPTIDGQSLTAQTNFRAGLVLRNGGGVTAGVEVTEVSDGRVNITPTDSLSGGVGRTISRRDQSGLTSVFSSPAITLMDGNLFGFSATMVGNAVRVGPRGTAGLGITTAVDASNTGQLSFVLPVGTSIAGLDAGRTLDWITTDSVLQPVPLPSGLALLLSSVFGLTALGRFSSQPPGIFTKKRKRPDRDWGLPNSGYAQRGG